MLINNTLYTVLSILIPILFIVGLSIFVKKVFNSYYGVFFGLVFSGFIFGAFQASAGKVYLILPQHEVTIYRTWGAFDFALTDETKQEFSVPQGKTLLINTTKQTILIEEIIYGPQSDLKNQSTSEGVLSKFNAPSSAQSYTIAAHSYEVMDINKNTIDFIFEDEIPEVIEEYGVHGKIIKYWLHD